MRRAMLAATLLCLLSFAVPGCAAPRDVSTPRKTLLGHWRNTVPGMNPDVYYSPAEVTYAGLAAASPTAGYTVMKEDPQEFTLEISAGAAVPAKISFSDDRNTMTVLPAKIPELLRYEYVDGEQKP